MKNVKKSAVIISALLLVCAILFTGCPNASGGAKPPADSAGSSGGSSGGTGSGGGSSGGSSGGSGSGGSGGGAGGSGGSAGGTVRLTIRGDERTTIAAPDFIVVDNGKTWAQIKGEGEIEPKVSLETEWQLPAGAYGIQSGG